MTPQQANEAPSQKQRAREIIEQLTKLDNSKKPGGGVHGQVIGLEPYIIRTTGDGLQCLWEAGALLDELLDPFDRRAPAPTSEPGARDAEVIQLRAQNMLLVRLYEAAAKLVKAKGRFHTEANYGALVRAYDLVRTAEFPDLATPASPAVPAAPLALSEDYGWTPEKITEFSAVLDDLESDPAPLVAQASPELPTAEDYDEMLRALCFQYGVGGYNSEGLMPPAIAAEKLRFALDEQYRVGRELAHLPSFAPEASPLVEDAQHFYTFAKPKGWINLLNPCQSWEQWTKTQGLPTTRGWKVFGTRPVVGKVNP